MPRLDGLETALSLKSDPKTRDIPIIMATAHTRQTLLSNAIEAGAADVLIKPYKLSDLRDIVEKYLPPVLSDDISHERLL
jgi:CheY-like chemotaxis protein